MRNILAVLLIATLSISISCSKPKKDATDVGSDSDVGSKALNFDPTGSDSGNIAGLSTVRFALDKYALSSDAKKKLAGNAEWMKTNGKVNLQVEGHCDERGSVEYNLALGEKRAKSVKKYLEGLGVAAGRISIISYGKEKPVDGGDSESAYNKNRRANFVPMPN